MLERALLAAISVAALLAGTTAAAAPVALSASAEAGPELDTNATRVQRGTEDEVRAGLFRVSGVLTLKLRRGQHVLALEYGGGAKLFVNSSARSADGAVQLAGVSWGTRFRFGTLWVAGTYYDAFQRESVRDFRSGTGSVGLTLQPGASLQATLSAGYRGLEYKPFAAYGFNGVAASALLAWRLASGHGDAAVDWDIRLGYAAGARFYAGQAVAPPLRCDSGALCYEAAQREDLHHLARVELQYSGLAELVLGYALELNRSNSYGETYSWHALTLKFTSHLVWGLYLTAKGTLSVSRFEDPFLVSEVSSLSFASIDNENRSSLVLELARDLSERWALALRYGLYLNESTLEAPAGVRVTDTGSGFLRHTLFLGARFEYGR